MPEETKKQSPQEATLEALEKLLEPNFAKEGFCGFYPPYGWATLISELHAKLVAIDAGYVIDQVKEKWGELRFYCTFSDACTDREAANKLVCDAMDKSAVVCERCGAGGAEISDWGGYWLRALCPDCGARHFQLNEAAKKKK